MLSKPEAGEKWALITGASSGIGKALACELAARGYHLFLTARNPAALEQVAADCAREFGVRTETHPADLSDPAAVESLAGAVAGSPHPFGFLVNNAGFGVRGSFLNTDAGAELDMLEVQLAAMLKLTKAVAPGMTARKAGHILNVGSVYSFSPVPNQAVYGACKAFLFAFSAALREELKGTGVTVTALCPGVTQTEFRARAGIPEKSRASGATADEVARAAVRRTLRGDAVIIPGFANRLFVFLARHAPLRLMPRLMSFINDVRGVNLPKPS